MAMSKWMLLMLILQSVLCILRFCLLLDIMGGFIMAICVGFGWYAWTNDMSISFVSSWGLMGLINGGFDLARLIDHAVHSPLPLFSGKASTRYNVNASVSLLDPISLILGAVLALIIYRRQTQPDEESFVAPERDVEQEPTLRPRQPHFNTFGGQGHRLGS